MTGNELFMISNNFVIHFKTASNYTLWQDYTATRCRTMTCLPQIHIMVF